MPQNFDPVIQNNPTRVPAPPLVDTPDAGKFPDSVLFFARALRRAGLTIGSGQVIDAVHALEISGFSSRRDLKTLLYAIFVKRHEDSVVFDVVFERYWQRRGYVTQLMRMLAPMAESNPQPQKPKAASHRAAEALFPNDTAKPKPREELQLDARLTTTSEELLRTRDFAQMSAQEIRAALAAIKTLRLPEDVRRTRRFAADQQGAKIDARKTLRLALKSGGDFGELAYRTPRFEPRPVVALCDISGSMQDYTQVFLHFLHTLSRQRRVETFLFGTRLTRVTRALQQRDCDEALQAVSSLVPDWSGGTQIGRTLEEFNYTWSRRVLGTGAMVLLLSDGLERDTPERLGAAMQRLHKSCHRLIFLNPLLRYDGFAARAEGLRVMLANVDELRAIHSVQSMADLCASFEASARILPQTNPQVWLNAV